MKRWLCLILLLVSCSARAGEEMTAHFDAANKLYEQGKFADAIQAYHKMIQAGETTAAVYFNLGNACFKDQRLGEAIASYRLAKRLAPRDPEIQANLRFVRDAAGTHAEDLQPWWIGWAQHLSGKEWAWLVTLGVWLTAGLGVLRKMKQEWQPVLKWPFDLTLCALLFCLAGGGLAWWGQYGRAAAVVKVKEAVVRYGPLDDSQSAFTLSDGTEVVVTDQKDGWWRVQDGQGKSGWVKDEEVQRLDALTHS